VAYESGVADIVDALGGAYHVERLTDGLEARAVEYLKRIDDMGGMVRAIEQGFPQQEIQNAAYEAQRSQETGKSVVVGVNKFQKQEKPPEGLLRVDARVETEQKETMARVRASRDSAAVKATLDALRGAAKKPDENLIPFIYDAVKVLATLGEISNALRDVFGEHKEHVVL
jgi:methylmalonyl-CoA mutase N-terminal domain/subunit